MIRCASRVEMAADLHKVGAINKATQKQLSESCLSEIQQFEAKGAYDEDRLSTFLGLAPASLNDWARESVSIGHAFSLSGYYLFIGFIWAVAIGLVLVAIVKLIGIHLLLFLLILPVAFWEALGYILCFLLMTLAGRASEESAPYLALTGLLGISPLLSFSIVSRAQHSGRDADRLFAVVTGLSFPLWLICSLKYNSALLGFGTCILFVSFFGFRCVAGPLCVMIGFTDEAVIPRAVFSSLVLNIVSLYFRLLQPNTWWFRPFESGAMFMGTYVYFLGLLILSAKSYWRYDEKQRRYQVAFVLSAAFFYWIGAVYNFPQYIGIVGTFFVLWLVGQLAEALPWHDRYMAWSMLALGVLLYLSAWFLQSNPQYIISFTAPSV